MALAALLVVVTLACFGRAIGFDFVNYDDNKYIQTNPMVLAGLTIDGARWAFTTFTLANWHPLTWLSHMVDVELFELDAGMHHFVNVLIHAANAVLLLVLLARMTGSVWRSALVAALFALHPLHVESVAWISERKDVLSTFFGLLAMLAYVRGITGTGSIFRTRILVLLCYALSLMAKPMLVTLPCVLLLLDVWPLRRPWKSNLIIEKLPLFAMSIASAIITIIAQSRGGAISQLDAVPLGNRITNAIVSYAAYILQTIWPIDLAPLYPLPASWPTATVILAAAFLAILTIVACLFARRRPYLIIGWLWYLGTLVPVIGLIQVGSQARADRYTYFPLIGLFIMISWSIPEFRRDQRMAIAVRNTLVAAVLLACAVLTWRQLGFWKDSISLSQRAIAVTPANAVAEFNLANALVDADRMQESLAHFIKAARLRPGWADPDNNLGNACLRLGQTENAMEAWRRALATQPQHPNANTSLGVVLAQSGDLQGAAEYLARAVEINPQDAVARMFYATVLRDLGQTDQAVAQFEQAALIAQQQGDAKLLNEIRRRMGDTAAHNP